MKFASIHARFLKGPLEALHRKKSLEQKNPFLHLENVRTNHLFLTRWVRDPDILHLAYPFLQAVEDRRFYSFLRLAFSRFINFFLSLLSADFPRMRMPSCALNRRFCLKTSLFPSLFCSSSSPPSRAASFNTAFSSSSSSSSSSRTSRGQARKNIPSVSYFICRNSF